MDEDNKVEFDLTFYPELRKAMESHPEEARQVIVSMLRLADTAVSQEHIMKCHDTFGMAYFALLNQITQALFDYKGILKHHYSRQEAMAMATLEMENNPLSSIQFFTADGRTLTKEEFVGGDEVTVKEWFQSLLYAGKYLSHVDLVKYLLLSEFHLVENMQNENIENLLRIQPALNFQKDNNIRIGAYVQGTSFFDVGTFPDWEYKCNICHSENVRSIVSHQLHYCLNCNAGIPFIKVEETKEASLASKYLEY